MQMPVAMKLRPGQLPAIYHVSVDPIVAAGLQASEGNGPAIIVTRSATIVQSASAVIVDAAQLLAVQEGDWSNAILLVLADSAPARSEPSSEAGDQRFLAQVRAIAPKLVALASDTIMAIRYAGVDGELVEKGRGRWVNHPLNTFTLKAQPRAGNLQFTLYGNPETYDQQGFLLQDQNSYSRGWVRNAEDVHALAKLAQNSHRRRAPKP